MQQSLVTTPVVAHLPAPQPDYSLVSASREWACLLYIYIWTSLGPLLAAHVIFHLVSSVPAMPWAFRQRGAPHPTPWCLDLFLVFSTPPRSHPSQHPRYSATIQSVSA